MRHINKHFMKIKMKHYYFMTKFCLNKADKHINEDEFWIWMKKSREYTNKYIKLYSEMGL